jgi:hypothetical protein
MHWKVQVQVFKKKDVFKGLKITIEGAMSALTIDAQCPFEPLKNTSFCFKT